LGIPHAQRVASQHSIYTGLSCINAHPWTSSLNLVERLQLTSPGQETETAIIKSAKLASNFYYYVRPLQVHNKTKSLKINNFL
jgi:hypothetical protein